jgi:hypothetical protein
MARHCQHTNKGGGQCKAYAMPDQSFCYFHLPKDQKERIAKVKQNIEEAGERKEKDGPKVEIIHEWNPPNTMEVKDKNPERRYRILNRKTVAQRGWREWAVVPPNDPEKLSNDGLPGSIKDGAKCIGDSILGYMPEEKAKAREKWYADLNKRRYTGVAEEIDAKIDRYEAAVGVEKKDRSMRNNKANR